MLLLLLIYIVCRKSILDYIITEGVIHLRWIDKLERKFGHIAIRGLMTYIVGITGFVYVLSMINSEFIYRIALIPSAVFKGEVWRLISYIFIPPASSPLWIIFALYFYYMIGSTLEHEWGSFRFNLYYFIGMLGTAAATLITGGIGTSLYLNLSLFLAFAKIYPDYEILIFFILPVKMKYLAWLEWIFIGITVLTAPIPEKVAAIVSVINYFVFFGADFVRSSKNRRHAYNNRKKYREQLPRHNYKPEYTHKCSVCGLTDKDDPNMDFRYCPECDGRHAYCREHIFNHEHIKEEKVIQFPGKEK